MPERNVNSIYEKNSRYVHGGTTEVSSTFLEYWNRRKIPVSDTDTTYTIEELYEGRPDLLAAVMYGDSRLWWVILQYNAILDPITEFVQGRELVLPTKDRMFDEILIGKIGGIGSKRKHKPER